MAHAAATGGGQVAPTAAWAVGCPPHAGSSRTCAAGNLERPLLVACSKTLFVVCSARCACRLSSLLKPRPIGARPPPSTPSHLPGTACPRRATPFSSCTLPSSSPSFGRCCPACCSSCLPTSGRCRWVGGQAGGSEPSLGRLSLPHRSWCGIIRSLRTNVLSSEQDSLQSASRARALPARRADGSAGTSLSRQHPQASWVSTSPS